MNESDLQRSFDSTLKIKKGDKMKSRRKLLKLRALALMIVTIFAMQTFAGSVVAFAEEATVTEESEQKAKDPEQKAEEPEQKAEEPEEKAEKPEEKAEKPEQKAEEPEEKAEKPEQKAEEPEEKAEKPEQKAEKPEEKAEKPEQKAEEPKQKAEEPEEKAEKPEQKAEEPEQKAEEPKQKAEEQEQKAEEPEQKAEEQEQENVDEAEPVETEPEPAKVPVYTEKKDQDGNPLVGALLQILDNVEKIWDEWLSDGTVHRTDLPEGDYVLHEKEAPEGYEKGEDIPFTVVIKVDDASASTTHDANPDVCHHYTGVPFYDVEEDGTHQEVYCINQGWQEPHEVNYDGEVLDVHNIKELAPDAAPEMTETELYNKVLDIVYHRSKAAELFPELSETEIRFITEYALKNYTSAMVSDGRINFFREYTYAPEEKKGYIVTPGNGNTLGKLAQHWWSAHGRKHLPERYVEFYNYLIADGDHHPEDMHLFIYSAKMQTEEGEAYQNLLGVKWFNPEDYKLDLTMVNVKKPEEPEKPEKPEEPEKPEKPEEPEKPEAPEKPEKPKKTEKQEEPEKTEPTTSPKTGDETNIVVYIMLAGFAIAGLGALVYVRRKKF